MNKLTSILALAEAGPSGLAVVDKAAMIAHRFEARVECMVTDPTQMVALATHCATRGYGHLFTLSRVHRGPEYPETLILNRARESLPDLVIKAPAGAHPLRRWSLAPDDRRLAAECPVPLLLASQRPWADPVRMAAAIDVSDAHSELFARAILQSAGFFALGCRASLEVLYSERESTDERVRMARAVKLAQMVREFHVNGDGLRMYNGAPERILPPLLEERGYDLLAIGAVTHRNCIASCIESLSSKLADATDGDLLLVNPPRAQMACGPRLSPPAASAPGRAAPPS